jgi:hypothetical protein
MGTELVPPIRTNPIAPDWRCCNYRETISLLRLEAHTSTTFIDQIPPRLAVSGIEVDTVTLAGTLRPAALFNEVNTEIRSKILAWLRGFRDPVHEDCILGSKYREEALWRTPIADQWRAESTWIHPEPWIGDVYNLLLSSEDAQLSSEDYTMQYFEYMMTATNTRIPFSTIKGYLGLGAKFIRPGDIVVGLFGSDVPVVLRETGDGQYTLIGEAFVSGIMHGEIVEEVRGHPRRSEIFELV